MKKQKLTLGQLQVKSFQTQYKEVKGGTSLTQPVYCRTIENCDTIEITVCQTFCFGGYACEAI